MKLGGTRRSGNVEDRRGARGRVVAGGGLAAVAVVVAASLFPEVKPILSVLGLERPAEQQGYAAPIDDKVSEFAAKTLALTEDFWTDAFSAGDVAGAQGDYRPATLVLYSGATGSPCGGASSMQGPFYCPADRKIYIDPAFYDVMAKQLNAPGDFAQAYVIAHEVAHHVQNLQGRLAKVMSEKIRAASPVDGNRLTVRLELQADCYSGVWARELRDEYAVLESGDVKEALRAAFQVGDDVLQRMSGQENNEDLYTHGASDQRARWFLTGFQSGDLARCDTFGPSYAEL